VLGVHVKSISVPLIGLAARFVGTAASVVVVASALLALGTEFALTAWTI
jgi:hypothetical protein